MREVKDDRIGQLARSQAVNLTVMAKATAYVRAGFSCHLSLVTCHLSSVFRGELVVVNNKF